MIKQVTVGFPVKVDKCGIIRAVLLARRQHGIIGVGKFTAYSGEIEIKKGENPKSALVREFFEEAKTECMIEDIEPVGESFLTFYKTSSRQGELITFEVSNINLHLNLIHGCTGTPKDSIEMKDAHWFFTNEIPWDSMIESDAIVLKRLIAGKCLWTIGTYNLDTEKLFRNSAGTRELFFIRFEANRLSRSK